MISLARFVLISGIVDFGTSSATGDNAPTVRSPRIVPHKRSSDSCPSGNFTTPIGQIYSTDYANAGCGIDLLSDDLFALQQDNITCLTDCMTYCSGYGYGLAYGATYDFTTNPGTCACKGEDVLNAEPSPSNTTHSALAVNVNMNPSLSCPYTNASTQPAANGSEYQIHCNADMPRVNDLCPDTSPTYAISTNGTCPTHADSLEDCMNQCSAAHPLCLAVSYDPGMVTGYPNCYFKSNVSTANIVPTEGASTFHMAVMKNDVVFNTDSNCINGTSYTSPNQAEFEIACNEEAPTGNVVANYHMEDLNSCADACATYTNSSGVTCLTAVFDSTLEFGYLNCYLQSNLTASNVNIGYHLALLTSAANGTVANSTLSTPGNPIPSGSTSGNSTTSSSVSPPGSSSNQAWIVSAVLGAVIGAAAVGGLVFWFRRRQRLSEPDQHPLTPVPQGGAEHAPLAELDYEGQKHELP